MTAPPSDPPSPLDAESGFHAPDARQLLHLACGGGAFFLYYWPSLVVAFLVALGALGAIAIRAALGANRLHRAREGLVNSGPTWYAAGVILAILFFPPPAAFVGWLTLAAGDSAATLAGSRWPILKFRRGNSLGGLLAFAAAAALALAAGLRWWQPSATDLPWGAITLVAAISAAAETVIPRPVDDNLYIPALAAGLYTMAAL